MKDLVSFAMVGAGRLAWSLLPALQQAGLQCEAILSRNVAQALRLSSAYHVPVASDLSGIPSSQIIFLVVSDAAIASVAALVAPRLRPDQMLVHCSGSVPLAALGDHPSRGVLYPMQAFTQDAMVSFQESPVPLFVEGSDPVITEQLLALAARLSPLFQVMVSETRKKLHLGAVMVSNFTNLLFRLAVEVVPEVDLHMYEPLIRHQVEQAMRLGPVAAQTGPAIRGDMPTIKEHLRLLGNRPELASLYWLLSLQINPSLSENHGEI
ncbi:MAG: DUF2520 domain-containing protein [Bacteroidia bacterium]|nr:DUF2520 domain-containing protein [Bacteroidia bacterium]